MTERTITAASLEAFRQHLCDEERSNGTIRKYIRDLRALSAWLGERELTKETAMAWKESLREASYAPVTVNSMLAAMNNYASFMGWSECRVKYLRLQRRLFREQSRELTREEYKRLVTAARDSGKERLALLMETICATGIRVSEVCYLTVEAAAQGSAQVSMKGKIRTILLPEKLCRKLSKYAKKQGITSGEIFLTKTGTSLDRKQIWAEMKRLCKKAGVKPSKVFPHNLRHLFARAFYQVSRDVAKLADVLGHSCIETTRIYLISTGEEHKKQLECLGLIQ